MEVVEGRKEDKQFITINKKVRVDNIVAFAGGAATGVLAVSLIKTKKPEVIVESMCKCAVTIAAYQLLRTFITGK